LEAEKVTGWHRKQHIFRNPLYYVEYGLAQVGAAQVWRNSLRDHAGAVKAYRSALALGGTRPLPELFAAAGARFGWDKPLLGEMVDLIETTLERIDS
jgi:oligoendopeptidase F